MECLSSTSSSAVAPAYYAALAATNSNSPSLVSVEEAPEKMTSGYLSDGLMGRAQERRKEIHPVEKQTLPSFFNGKSEKRTPEIYLGIRNSIMMKFHANPRLQLEFKDLAELSIGETDARQEVLEFLDHWGLINFHPFPPAGHEESKPEESQDNSNDEKASLIEQLFKFELVQSYMMPLPKKEDVGAPPPLPSLFQCMNSSHGDGPVEIGSCFVSWSVIFLKFD